MIITYKNNEYLTLVSDILHAVIATKLKMIISKLSKHVDIPFFHFSCCDMNACCSIIHRGGRGKSPK